MLPQMKENTPKEIVEKVKNALNTAIMRWELKLNPFIHTNLSFYVKPT